VLNREPSGENLRKSGKVFCRIEERLVSDAIDELCTDWHVLVVFLSSGSGGGGLENQSNIPENQPCDIAIVELYSAKNKPRPFLVSREL